MAILTKGVKLSELGSMSSQEHERQVQRLFQDALTPTEDQIQKQRDELDSQIKAFERQYELPSATMQQQLACGAIRETATICSWLMLLKLRKRLDADRTQAQSE